MSGFDAMQRLREWPETQGIPVIGLSAAALLNDTSHGQTAGFYRYLTKPVKVAELTRTSKSCWSTHAGSCVGGRTAHNVAFPAALASVGGL